MADKIGATGAHPNGKLNSDDDGELRFAIGEDGNTVILDFGTPVKWLGLPPEQAVALAKLLIAKARVVAKRQGKTLTVEL